MKKIYSYVFLTGMLFGSMEVALKIGGATFNPIQLTFIRFLIGGLFLLPFAISDLKKKQIKLNISDLGYLLTLGLICICFSMVLFQIGLMGINASLAALIFSINPVFTMVFAHFIVHEKFTKKKAIALTISIIGLIIVMNPQKLASGENNIWFLLMTLVAAIAFGLYTAYGKKRIAKIGGVAQNSFSFLMGSAVLLIMLVVSGQPVFQGVSLETAPLLFYLGVCVTGIGYYFYLKTVEIAGPSMASVAFFIKPMVAPIFALVILGEAITLNIGIGLVFILFGSFVNLTDGDKLVKMFRLEKVFYRS
ncbi:DMT family transporter [Acetobacterium malicum]|uniref:EamA family transporter n=1 Tax=Acetobacterium malicum TaxID=52692 RepID=A0ABR6Z0K1_9FIRM|nr:DMT family transporter [Acetobacterium malicum]MBC3900637.1 EamA family transporter [Acetobacterium malicum]